MKCIKCGREFKENEEFCAECGTPRPGSTGQITKNGSGVSENTLGLVCYLIGILSIIFVFTEKRNKFIRFHAIQSTILNVTYFVLIVIFSGDTALYGLAALVFLILWIVLMYKAYKGEKYKLPVIGDYAEGKA